MGDMAISLGYGLMKFCSLVLIIDPFWMTLITFVIYVVVGLLIVTLMK